MLRPTDVQSRTSPHAFVAAPMVRALTRPAAQFVPATSPWPLRSPRPRTRDSPLAAIKTMLVPRPSPAATILLVSPSRSPTPTAAATGASARAKIWPWMARSALGRARGGWAMPTQDQAREGPRVARGRPSHDPKRVRPRPRMPSLPEIATQCHHSCHGVHSGDLRDGGPSRATHTASRQRTRESLKSPRRTQR